MDTPDFTKAWTAGYLAALEELRAASGPIDIFGLLICATVDANALAPEYPPDQRLSDPEGRPIVDSRARALRASWFDGRSTALRTFLIDRAEGEPLVTRLRASLCASLVARC